MSYSSQQYSLFQKKKATDQTRLHCDVLAICTCEVVIRTRLELILVSAKGQLRSTTYGNIVGNTGYWISEAGRKQASVVAC